MALRLFLLCVLVTLTFANQENDEKNVAKRKTVGDVRSLDYAARFAALENLLAVQGQEISDLQQLLVTQDDEIIMLQQLAREREEKEDRETMRVKHQKDKENVKVKHQKDTEESAKVSEVGRESGADSVSRGDRADDTGSIGVMVQQLSQHVDQLDADLQAYKAQAASDLHTATQHVDTVLNNLQTSTTASLNALNNTVVHQAAALQDAATSVFVHWGNNVCGTDPELVYSGFMGGSLFNETGAATNFLCLTDTPIFAHEVRNRHFGAHLYGSEYQTNDRHTDLDPLCAVCRTPYSTTVMIPGTNTCGAGWLRQYFGFLMAGGYGDAAGSEFICVDHVMASADHSNLDQDGKSLFYTETHCGSLPCTPYEGQRTVLCVVCSK
jgi:hypothetical protein